MSNSCKAAQTSRATLLRYRTMFLPYISLHNANASFFDLSLPRFKLLARYFSDFHTHSRQDLMHHGKLQQPPSRVIAIGKVISRQNTFAISLCLIITGRFSTTQMCRQKDPFAWSIEVFLGRYWRRALSMPYFMRAVPHIHFR
jgi:hypothetical protein